MPTPNAIGPVTSAPTPDQGLPGVLDPESPSPEDGVFVVHGEVVRPDGAPLPGYRVRALDRGLCEFRPLGDAQTDKLGRYRIAYGRQALEAVGKTRADLQVEVRAPGKEDEDRPLATSPLFLQALPIETVDFAIGKQRYRGPDEHTRVQVKLDPLLEPVGDLNCLGLSDVLMLARDSGVPSSTVAYEVKARRWAQEVGETPALFYGLLRQGAPLRLDAVLARPVSRLLVQLEQANRLNIVDLPVTEALRARLVDLQERYLLRPEHPYRQLLDSTDLSDEQQVEFTRQLTAADDIGAEFWTRLHAQEGFDDEVVADVQNTFELQSLTGDNTSLTVHLRAAAGVRSARETATFGIERWRDDLLTADGVEVPDWILPTASEADRRTAYAEQLYRGAEVRYPTASLTGQMQRSQSWAGHPVLGFLIAYPFFAFEDVRVLAFVAEHPQATEHFPDTDANYASLLRVEQLFHLTRATDRLAAIQPLWDAGLRSAPQIARLGRRQLGRAVGGALDRSVVADIYQRAVHVTAFVQQAYLRYHPAMSSPPLYALGSAQLPRQQGAAPAARALPEWAELFGSADSCACSFCESATSPGAYLVDGLAFLQRADDGAGKNALEYLLERRPDLGTIRLDCENTETDLPEIDLLVEILEQLVAFAPDGTTIPADAIGQTTWDAELLDAVPEHMEPLAYERLRNALHPFDHLPFHLWLVEARQYLARMGIARHELMSVLPRLPGVTLLDIATETLGMSPTQRRVIAAPKTGVAALTEAWGTAPARLHHVSTLLMQAHIDYDTLVALLNTRYVNPDRLTTITFGTPCVLDTADLVMADRRPFLDRLHRYLRLQWRTGMKTYELDTLLRALAIVDFDQPDCFTALADVQTLAATLDVPVTELATWWATLDTYQYEHELASQYEAVFLDPVVFPPTHTGTGPDLRDEVFALNSDRSDLAVAGSGLSPWLAQSDGALEPTYSLNADYAAYIQSATQLTSIDLARLAADVLPKDPATGHVALDLVNVSLLARVASLTAAFDITVTDYLRLLGLTGSVPLTTADTTATPTGAREFHERFRAIDDSGRSIDELAYLLLHDTEAALTHAPATEQMDAWLETLKAPFAGILDVNIAAGNDVLRTALTQSLGATLNLDATVLDALLFTHRRALGKDLLAHLIVAANPAAPSLPTASEAFHTVFERVHKFGVAWRGLGLDPLHLAFVLERGPALGWSDPSALPMDPGTDHDPGAWARLVDAAQLQLSVFTVENSLFALLELAAATTMSREEFLALLGEWTGWALADLLYLTAPGGFALASPAALRDERPLVALDAALALIRRTGVSAVQVHAWTGAEVTFAETESIKQALTLAYEPDGWLAVMADIQDELRSLRRDALLGQILSSMGTSDSSDFYRHYLIDAEKDPCARTSRMVSAHAAFQLFAQRILLNLEPPLSFAREDADAWWWRKSYRVWEAARTILLHTENFLDPGLRDNASIFFSELKDGLDEGDVTSENAERLYHEYLSKLDRVSRLEVMGMYDDEDTDVLHVVGRTPDTPARYYHRRWEDKARWTPWELVDLDIEGDHVIPVVYNGRLYLFWPKFEITQNPEFDPNPGSGITHADEDLADVLRSEIAEIEDRIDEIDENIRVLEMTPKADEERLAELTDEREDLVGQLEDKNAELAPLTGPGDAPAPEVDRYDVNVGMAWSQYQNGSWSPKTLSKQTRSYTTNDELYRHHVSGWVSDDNRLHLTLRTDKNLSGSAETAQYVGRFYFDDCGAELLFNSLESDDPQSTVTVTNGLPWYQTFAWGNDTWGVPQLQLEVAGDSTPRTLVSGEGYLLGAHQYGGGRETSPFFLTDAQRSFFVQPDPGSVGTASYSGAVLSSSRSRRKISSANGASTVHYQDASADVIVDRSLGVAAGDQPYSGLILLIEDEAGDKDEPGEALPNYSTLYSGLTYLFSRFYHPFVCLFMKQLARYGIDGLLRPDPELSADSEDLYRQLTPNAAFNFAATYVPNNSWVDLSHPVEEIDFDHYSPYGLYNWELFFHIPMLIASKLMDNQRFEEAQRWLHFIFNPTQDGDAPQCFWMIRPFYEQQSGGPTQTLQELLDLLENGDPAMEQQVREWEQDPVNPHRIARLRITAYMRSTVMRYLDCIIGRADNLFASGTRENVNEAAGLYLLASEILGEQPTMQPAVETAASTPNALLAPLSTLGSGIDLLERLASLMPVLDAPIADNPLADDPFASSGPAPTLAQVPITTTDTLLLFCVPHNSNLDTYWQIVGDRLFKIRHCMDIAGEIRHLPLYDPPIDPMLLVRAAALGLDMAAIVSGLQAPLPIYRFGYLLQKAMDLCGDVRNLGGAVLAALEKRDAEAMALLRGAYETSLLAEMGDVKRQAIEEAELSLAALQKSRESAEFRASHYAGLERVSASEQRSLDKQEVSRQNQARAEQGDTIASIVHLVANVSSPVTSSSFGGSNLGSASQAIASHFRAKAAGSAHIANKIGVMAGYARRQQEWKLQGDLARKEVEQLDKQILALEIRKQMAERELAIHETQTAQAAEVEALLTAKFSNEELYGWMVSKLSGVYFGTYQIALDLAKQAQTTFQYELGLDPASATYVEPAYWDSLKNGLAAGEQLHRDLRRMEVAHLEAHSRDFEITKDLSLFQLDPTALLTLRETGRCTFHVPEVLFDMDFHDHYYRRIKTVRVTIPCVTGPYTNVSATLRLTQSWTRRTADVTPLKTPDGPLHAGGSAVTTSSAKDDSGQFVLDFNDPRYLRFEGAGVISSWELELPRTLRPFDYDTIADVIVSMSYTARASADPGFGEAVDEQLVSSLNDLKKAIGDADVMPSRLFSMRQEFSAHWHRLLFPAESEDQTATLTLTKQHFPRYLDYLWEPNGTDALTPAPIALRITHCTVYLNPDGPLPDAVDLQVNGEGPVSDANMTELLVFSLDPAAALSSTLISNEASADLTLTLTDGVLAAEDWRDLYVLVSYEVIS